MNYLFDTQDLHILGFNQCLLDNYPTRFRVATDTEIDAHFEEIGKSRYPVDAVEARKAERLLAKQMAEADERESIRADEEYRANLLAKAVLPVVDAVDDQKAMRVARAKKAGAASKAKRDALKALK